MSRFGPEPEGVAFAKGVLSAFVILGICAAGGWAGFLTARLIGLVP